MIERDKPFSHRARNGVELRSMRADLLDTSVQLHVPANMTTAQIAEGVAEIIGWWTLNVYPDITSKGQGYRGMDCITFEIVRN